MKRGYLVTALLFTAFMFPFFGNINDVDALGNYQCGNKDRKTHVNCLRAKLDSTPYGLTVPKGKRGLGKYGCGTKQRRKHVNCLRRLLDQHGPHLAKGSAGPTNAPGIPTTGMHPPMGQPGMPPMGMPTTGTQPVLPPTGGMPTAAIPPTDPCMAVTDANDRATCLASHAAPPMGMPATGMHPPMGQPGMPPMGMPATGMHPPMGQPGMPPMGMPTTGTQPVLPPTGGMSTTAIPPTDPCMAVTDANDRATCLASHAAPGMMMPPGTMAPGTTMPSGTMMPPGTMGTAPAPGS
jgi:hypothetical protein